jgi:osmoprotectant transport system permease protein
MECSDARPQDLGSPVIVGLSSFNTAYVLKGSMMLAPLAVTVDMVFEYLARRLAWLG